MTEFGQIITSDVLGGGNATRKSRVSYYFDEDFATYQVHATHPMKPFRVKMTDTLVKCYGMDKKMQNMKVDEDFIEQVDLTKFHADDYIDCLRNITVDKKDEYID